MAHHGRYDSTLTKKSQEKKDRAKSKSGKFNVELSGNEFVVKKTEEIIGTVIETQYNEATVLFNEEMITAQLKNGLNMVCNQTVFSGDKVVIRKQYDGKYTINNLLERKNVLSKTKKDSTRTNQNAGINHIIATNIDMAVIVVSAKTPPLHPKFIDRYLMILQDNGIECAICLNKSDLKTQDDEEILDIYRKINIPILETSVNDKTGIEDLKKMIKDKQTIFVGHSGVGKSSLTNALINSDDVKTSNVSKKSGKGRHTTTTSKYYVWDESSSIIDTPGIRSLDVSHFLPIEIQKYFSEFNDLKNKCKYSNCLHYKELESDCIVKQSVNSGIISKERYNSYIRILKDTVQDRELDSNYSEVKTTFNKQAERALRKGINITDSQNEEKYEKEILQKDIDNKENL